MKTTEVNGIVWANCFVEMVMAYRKGKRRGRKQQHHSWWQQMPAWIWILSFGVVLIMIGVGMSFGNSSAAAPIDHTSPELVAQGQAIFNETCAVCHGSNGEGDVGSPLNGSAHAWHHVDNQLRSFIRDGIPDTAMAGHGEHLTEQEIGAVISFIKTWWTPQQREMQRTGNHPMG
jgi:mono/diheme cytochrome c family protein